MKAVNGFVGSEFGVSAVNAAVKVSKKAIYIAGKISGPAVEYVKNLHNMFVIAEEVRKAGFSVFVPGLDCLMGLMFGYYKYDDYFNNSQPWLRRSDAVFVSPNWETSDGTKKEIEFAKVLGIPVYYSLEEMKKDLL